MSPVQIAWYDNYTVFLNHRLAKLAVLIRDAERIAELKKSELVAIMREIKTLERLKEEQYLTYLEDSAKEQEKELGDLMSFQSTGEKGNLIPEMA
jgi:flagellar biosynthesis chaperone FliJ